MRPRARSLILELLSTLREGAMPVRALVAAGELFGIAGNSTRVALTRLHAAGLVERDERACYRLGAGAQAVQARVSSWRRLDDRLRAWRGAWLGVHTAGPQRSRSRAARQRHERALRLLGFRALAPGLEVRPDNLAIGPDGVRAELAGLGLAPGCPLFLLQGWDPEHETRARSLWDVEALRSEYAHARRRLDASARRLAGLEPAAAMVESFRVGGTVIRQLVLDPLLPAAILAGDERSALVESMRRYDRLGRSCWAAFLARFGVPHRRTPADTGLSEATRTWAGVGGLA